MYFSRKIVLLIFLFLSISCFVFYNYNDNYKNYDNGIYDTRKMTINGWDEKVINSSRLVLDTLQATVTIFSNYIQGDSGPVNLYIGYYDTIEKSKLSHAPQVCFTAQGWIIIKNDKIYIRLNGVESKVSRLILEKENEKLLVYYWYQNKKFIYPDAFRMKLALLGRKLKFGKDTHEGNAFIRISTFISQNSESSASLLQKFAENLDEELPQVLGN